MYAGLRTSFVGASALLVALIGGTGAARAATLDAGAGSLPGLISAINAANAAAGPDTILVSGTYSGNAADNFWYGPNLLPPITSDITIQGSPSATIQGTNGSRLRLLFVADARSGLNAGTLRLRNVELRGGVARGGSSGFGGGGAGMGGAIFNRGTLDLSGVTLSGNTAAGGASGTVNATGGAGMGADASLANGGGFGGSVGGAGGSGGAASASGPAGGGGGGHDATDDGASGDAGGTGGGFPNGLGGPGQKGASGGASSGAGGTSTVATYGSTGAGGDFGFGGKGSTPPAATNGGGGGGGGVGGGGGASAPGVGGGHGGFGGGGGWANIDSGSGGFGGGAAGIDARNAQARTPKAGFGGGNIVIPSAGIIGIGGGGAGMGGAIFNDGGTVTVTNSTITGNTAQGGLSTSAFTGPSTTPGNGGDGLGGAIFNLNGAVTLAHTTITGNSTAGGGGASAGRAGSEVSTVGYAPTVRAATTAITASIVRSFEDLAPTPLADGTVNKGTATTSSTLGSVTGVDPQVASLGDYGGPTRTLALLATSPAIDAASGSSTTTDQRGYTRSGSRDAGAVETVPTTVSGLPSITIPFSTSAQNISLSATISPARGTVGPGTVTFTLTGIIGSIAPSISGTSASGTFAVPANTPPGTYAIHAAASAASGFAAGSDTSAGTLKILKPAPVCQDISVTTAFETAKSIASDCTSVAAGDAAAIVDAASHGTATAVGSNLQYTPNAGYYGTDTFTYTVTNEGGASAKKTVTVKTLKPAPVCQDISKTTAFETAITIPTDCTGDTPSDTVDIVDNASHGTATIVSGDLKYTPDAGYFGTDTFTYTVTNEGGTSTKKTVTVKTLKPAPVCQDISATTAFETAKSIASDCTSVAAGDAAAIVDAASHGTATAVGSNLQYTPDTGYYGTDTFTYTVTNEGGTSTKKTVTVKTLKPAPVCQDISVTTAFETAKSIASDCTSVAAGDAAAIVDAASHGTATAVGSNLQYTPDAGYFGTDTFTYTVTNEGGTSTKKTVTVKTLKPAPVCQDISKTTAFETAITIPTDCTGDTPSDTVDIVDNASHGTATIVSGDLKYTPDAGYFGTDTFTYTVTNEGGASAKKTVSVTVLADEPACASRSVIVGADRTTTLALACTSAIAQSYEVVTPPAHGTLTALDAATGKVKYTPASGYTGPDQFTYRSQNTSGAAATATVVIEVKPAPSVTVSVARGSTVLGESLSADATVTQRLAPVAEPATVRFRLYGPGDDTCAGPAVFTSSNVEYPAAGGSVGSGSFTPTATGTYRWRATYSGDDLNAGADSACDAAKVVVAPVPPTPTPTPAAPVPQSAPTTGPICGRTVVLLEVRPVRGKALVSGIARSTQIGATVTVLRSGQQVGTTTVRADGTFSTTVAGPSPTAGRPTTYRVRLGKSESRALRYDRGLRIVKRVGRRITGQLTIDRRSFPRVVQLQRIDTCTKQRSTTAVRVSKSGRFSVTLDGPRDAEPYALYRVFAEIGSTVRVFSTQVAVAR